MNLFGQINFMNTALDAYSLRNDMISNNIANADTPDYKRKIVEFENLLNKENQKFRPNGESNVKPVVKELTSLSYRLDGNGVDIDVEMAERAKNEMRYRAVIESVSHQLKAYNVVLRSK